MGFWSIGAASFLLVIAAALMLQRMLEVRDRKRFPPPGRLVPIGGGRVLHLLEAGEGPVVIVEQGAGEPAILWRRIQREASSFAHVCLYDRAGYGWSPAAPEWQDVDARAADLRALLENAGLPGPYVLVAHSYGGLVVRAFARLYPDKVRALVMVDAIEESIAFHPDYLGFLKGARPFLVLMRAAAALGLMRLVGRLSGGGDGEDGVDPESGRMAGAQSARAAFYAAIAGDVRSIAAAARAWPLPEGMGGLGDIPVTALTHGKPFPGPFARIEPLWLPGQERWIRLTSRGELIVAKDSNHMIQMDEPELVVAALRKACAAETGAKDG